MKWLDIIKLVCNIHFISLLYSVKGTTTFYIYSLLFLLVLCGRYSEIACIRFYLYGRQTNCLDKQQINGDIRAKEVRLIDENGDMRGVMGIREALARARRRG